MEGSSSDRGAYRSTDTCVTCGRAIDVNTAAYTGDGMVCAECEAGELVREANLGAGASSGIGALGWGLLSLVCNPLFIPSVLAIAGGTRELRSLGLFEPEQRAGRQVQAIFAIILGAFWPAMIVGMVGLMLLFGVAGAVMSPDRHDSYYDDPYYQYEEPYPPSDYDEPYYDDQEYEPYPADPVDEQTLDELMNEELERMRIEERERIEAEEGALRQATE